jgi:hypothetical protein
MNPFSNNELEVMGESALARLLRQLESQSLNRRMCLTLLKPTFRTSISSEKAEIFINLQSFQK